MAAWMDVHPGELGALARHWFAVVRGAGAGVCEVMHDGCPTACVGDAAFAYVGIFKGHVNVGFFRGAALPDPRHLLRGTGKLMRHVRVEPGGGVDAEALATLIVAAHADIVRRLEASRAP
ncbi:MAG: DUF1801 domain-containing protein [Gemmatimonadales bacterium]